jgi:hypothetical protein
MESKLRVAENFIILSVENARFFRRDRLEHHRMSLRASKRLCALPSRVIRSALSSRSFFTATTSSNAGLMGIPISSAQDWNRSASSAVANCQQLVKSLQDYKKMHPSKVCTRYNAVETFRDFIALRFHFLIVI